MEEFQNPLSTYERCWSIYMLWMGTWIHYHEITTTYINPDFVWHRSLQSYLLHNQQCFKESELLFLVLQYLKYGNPSWKTLIANWLPMAILNCTQNNMVHAWVGHFVTPLKRRYNESDWWVTSQKPHKMHRSPNNHHHHGVGDACHGFDEPMPLEGWTALHMFLLRPPLKQFNRFNKLK